MPGRIHRRYVLCRYPRSRYRGTSISLGPGRTGCVSDGPLLGIAIDEIVRFRVVVDHRPTRFARHDTTTGPRANTEMDLEEGRCLRFRTSGVGFQRVRQDDGDLPLLTSPNASDPPLQPVSGGMRMQPFTNGDLP